MRKKTTLNTLYIWKNVTIYAIMKTQYT